MKNFLQSFDHTFVDKKYLDIGSSYGWFVKEFSKIGFNSIGLERDPISLEIGYKVYGIEKSQIIHNDIVLGLRKMIDNNQKYDIVSCLSVLHHFVLNKNSTSALELIKLIDNVTKHVLFLDTGEEHESAFEGTLNNWNPEFIKNWIKSNTSFKEVYSLGVDQDCKPPFIGYYNRTLFACIKS
ncbi:methyltransferase domain-containing protein [Fluviispira sanaruensis]|uniref:Methyltransferase type 11 domain-containing protein n=1 Tax=Fluviispira sanaruensis TaxID=2493639 RepID=A0A4P2VL94_FLUSA|nr:hypothetical protein JCM31447_25430 [Fluviispira sanaruensis]